MAAPFYVGAEGLIGLGLAGMLMLRRPLHLPPWAQLALVLAFALAAVVLVCLALLRQSAWLRGEAGEPPP